MAPTVEALPWESEVFGIPIGRVDVTGGGVEQFDDIEAQARALGLACLCATVDPAQRELTVQVQDRGYRFVDAGMMKGLRSEVPEPPPDPPDTTVRRGRPDDVDALRDAIGAAAEWSRYSVDPHFGVQAARRMHEAGVRLAADPAVEGRTLLVSEDASGLTSFLTYREGMEPSIDLFHTLGPRGADTQALFDQARRELGGETRTIYAGPLASRDLRSIRLCENLGYRVARTRYVYHRWFDEEPGARPWAFPS